MTTIKNVSPWRWIATEATAHYDTCGEFLFGLLLAGIALPIADRLIVMEVFIEAAKERRYRVAA